jgi:hypothetical protein
MQQKILRERYDHSQSWNNFLEDSCNEAKLTVYLGLQHKSDLRHFALSWPVIKTWIRASNDLIGLSKEEVYQLIECSTELSIIEDPEAVWPKRPNDSEESAFLKRKHRIAWQLIQMSKNIAKYIQSSDQDNQLLTQRYRRELSAILQHDITMSIRHPRPEVNPWKDQNPKEVIDRCWSILSYVSWIPYLKSWEIFLSFLTSPQNEALLYDSKKPDRVRARPSRCRLYEQFCSIIPYDVTEAPSPIIVKVIWDREREFDGKAILWRLLAKLVSEKKDPPRREQVMAHDPRLCQSAASFRDVVRRIMDCDVHGLDLNEVTLSYLSEQDKSYYQQNALQSQWNVLKGIFSDPDNKNFVLRVVLQVRSGTGDVYETTDLPPVR